MRISPSHNSRTRHIAIVIAITIVTFECIMQCKNKANNPISMHEKFHEFVYVVLVGLRDYEISAFLNHDYDNHHDVTTQVCTTLHK